MKSEIETRADFNKIRYSQCWEDADILLEAVDVRDFDTILSIASAGDNSFAMLAKNPDYILAVDLSLEQIACCELRKLGYKYFTYDEFMMFSGVIGTTDYMKDLRMKLYNKYKEYLPKDALAFWDKHKDYIKDGFMTVGRFENYFKIFREKVLPPIHNKETVEELFANKSPANQVLFYKKKWNTLRWKGMFKIFFSKKVMGKLGRDPEFYKYVTTSSADRIFKRAEETLKSKSAQTNPYLYYILHGQYNENLPFALRRENFEAIKKNINHIHFKQMSLEDALHEDIVFTCYNLSDIFEYMSQDAMDNIYKNIFKISPSGTRIVYWNMLVDRKCSFKDKIYYNKEKCKELLSKDKAFFYSDFVLERIR